MKIKRNRANSTITGSNSYIRKYFGSDIGKILTPSNKSLTMGAPPYVHHTEAEQILSSMLKRDPDINKSLAFTGLTGAGKSTILGHVFGIYNNSNQLIITDKKVIIPIDYNRSQEKNAQKAIVNSIRSAVFTLCTMYHINYPDDMLEEFYQFIYYFRRDQLFTDPEFSRKTSHREQLHTFQINQEMAFTSCQLQYVMNHPKCQIELIILILDNVEASNMIDKGGESGVAPIVEAFRLFECISHGQKEDKWNFHLVFACRHHIWRMLKGHYSTDDSNALLQSFITTETPYDLSQPVKMDDIVDARDVALGREQRDTWKQSVQVVKTVMKQMEGTIGQFLLELHLKDMRRCMVAMRELIQNQRLQKVSEEDIATGAFSIDSPDQYDLSRVNLIRTIGLGTNKYYSDDGLIPNLLRNDRTKGIEMYTLLSLKYFLIRCDYHEPSWDNSILISEFYSNVNNVFGFDDVTMNRVFKQSIIYLIRNRMLLRSADQNQLVVDVNNKIIEEVEHVYVSGAAVALWNELGRSSALFQLFMDDIWFDDNSEYLKENGNDLEHCYVYLSDLYAIEKEIYYLAENLGKSHARLYSEYFGIEPVCMQLALGIISSLKTISESGESLRVNKARITLNKLEGLYSHMCQWAEKNKLFLQE